MKPNRRKITLVALPAFAALVLVLASSAFASVAIYVNDMANTGRRAQIVKIFGKDCVRGGAKTSEVMRVTVGENTDECAYRTPVVGRDLEVEATARLLSGTPRKLQRRAFLAVELRAGGGGKYTFAVFPGQQKYQIFKDVPGEETKFLAVGKQISRIGDVNQANKLRLQVFNILKTKDPADARVLAYVNNKRMAVVVDETVGQVKGRFSGFSVGAAGQATGAIASFDDVSIRIPSPF